MGIINKLRQCRHRRQPGVHPHPSVQSAGNSNVQAPGTHEIRDPQHRPRTPQRGGLHHRNIRRTPLRYRIRVRRPPNRLVRRHPHIQTPMHQLSAQLR